MKLRFLFSFIFVCAFLLLPSIALGAVKLNLDYPSFGGFNLKDDQNISQLVAWTYYAMIGIAGLAAFVMLVWGGVQWLVSGAIPSQLSAAKEKIQNAILGILLIFGSFIIIQLINPEVGTIGNFEISAVQPLLNPAGIVLSRPPAGAVEQREVEIGGGAGIYFCTNYGCTCNTDDDGDSLKSGNPRRECSGITDGEKIKDADGKDTAVLKIGDPGSGEGKDDYYFFPMTVADKKETYDTNGDGKIDNGDKYDSDHDGDIDDRDEYLTRSVPWPMPEPWKSKIRSISIVQYKTVSEYKGILAYNTSTSGETKTEVICFDRNGAGNLKDYVLQSKFGFVRDATNEKGWEEKVGGFRIISETACSFPGITIDNEKDFWGKPVVFLFDKKNFGQIALEAVSTSKGNYFRRWGRPCKYFYSAHDTVSIHQVRAPYYPDLLIPPSPANNQVTTGQGCANPASIEGTPSDWDLLSVWIDPNANCFLKSKAYGCAVTFYECNGNEKCPSTEAEGDENPTNYDRICFEKPEKDLLQTQYSFDNNNPTGNDLRDDVRRVSVHANIAEGCNHGEISTPRGASRSF